MAEAPHYPKDELIECNSGLGCAAHGACHVMNDVLARIKAYRERQGRLPHFETSISDAVMYACPVLPHIEEVAAPYMGR